MNAARTRGIRILVAVFVVAIMTAMVAPALAQQGPEVRVSHFELDTDHPDPAVDSQGNVHIVFTARTHGTRYYQTFGTSPNRYTVIEWNTYHGTDREPGKFQAVLYENGDIDINIADNTGAVGEQNITGVNQGDGTHGVDIGGTATSNTSYRFTWNGATSDYDWSTISGPDLRAADPLNM